MPNANKSIDPKQSKVATNRIRKFPFLIRDMRKLPLSTEEEIYQVSFSASVRKDYGEEISSLDFSRSYPTVHPLYALGLAVADVESIYNAGASLDVRSIRITKL